MNYKELKAIRPVIGRRVHETKDGEKLWNFLAEKLQVGDVVRVYQGERFPLDGVIVRGNAIVASNYDPCKSTITEKHVGQTVFCGILNCGKAVDVRVTATYENTSLAYVLRSDKESAAEHSFMDSVWEKLKFGSKRVAY